MGRYSLNLRPIYGRDELTGGETLQRGIGAAIQQKLAEEAEDNQRRAQGQVMSSEATMGGRLGDLGNRIRGLFGSQPSSPPAPPAPGLATAQDANAAIQRGVLPFTGAAAGAPTPPPGSGPSMVAGTPPRPSIGNAAGAVLAQQTPEVPVPPAPVPAGVPRPDATARPTIADAIGSHDERDSHGNVWSVNPANTPQARMAEFERTAKAGDEERLIHLRGEEDRATQRERPVTALTYAERAALMDRDNEAKRDRADRNNAAREHLATKVASQGGRMTAEDRAADRALRAEALDIQRAALDQRDQQGADRAALGAASIYTKQGAPNPLGADSPEEQARKAKLAGKGAALAGDVAKRAASTAEREQHRHATQAEAAAYYQKLTGTHEQRVAAMVAAGFPPPKK